MGRLTQTLSLGGYAAVLEDHGGMSAPVAPCLDITEFYSVGAGEYAAILEPA